MEYLKRYKLFESGYVDHESIHNLCSFYNISKYTINDDGSIDVDDNVYLSENRLDRIPIKFNKVSGYFDCGENNLTSLENCPNEVGGDFYCFDNKLESLEFGPSIVNGNYFCNDNELTTLKGSPKRVGREFMCSNNKLTSLEYGPKYTMNYSMNINHINTFVGFPTTADMIFMMFNPIENIYKLFNDISKVELFNYYDIIRDDGQSIVLDRLNSFLEDIGKDMISKYHKIPGYKII